MHALHVMLSSLPPDRKSSGNWTIGDRHKANKHAWLLSVDRCTRLPNEVLQWKQYNSITCTWEVAVDITCTTLQVTGVDTDAADDEPAPPHYRTTPPRGLSSPCQHSLSSVSPQLQSASVGDGTDGDCDAEGDDTDDDDDDRSLLNCPFRLCITSAAGLSLNDFDTIRNNFRLFNKHILVHCRKLLHDNHELPQADSVHGFDQGVTTAAFAAMQRSQQQLSRFDGVLSPRDVTKVHAFYLNKVRS